MTSGRVRSSRMSLGSGTPEIVGCFTAGGGESPYSGYRPSCAWIVRFFPVVSASVSSRRDDHVDSVSVSAMIGHVSDDRTVLPASPFVPLRKPRAKPQRVFERGRKPVPWQSWHLGPGRDKAPGAWLNPSACRRSGALLANVSRGGRGRLPRVDLARRTAVRAGWGAVLI